jgi:DNA polymerase-3 subunit epsilon
MHAGHRLLPPFVAIDFETANESPSSACAVGVVRVEGGLVVATEHRLVRPDTRDFRLEFVHGITFERVASAPVFGDVWRDLAPVLAGAAFIAAHNASFDRGVLSACCAVAGIAPPELPFVCTVRLVREVLRLPRAKLSLVCEGLGIPLVHHDAGSDALACARLVLEAARAGWTPELVDGSTPSHDRQACDVARTAAR